MQISHYLSWHSDIQHNINIDMAAAQQLRYSRTNTAMLAVLEACCAFRQTSMGAGEARHCTWLKNMAGAHPCMQTLLLPAWQQRAAHHLIPGKMENGKAEKNTFPALLLLLSDRLCHRATVFKRPVMAGQGPCHRGTGQRWSLTRTTLRIHRGSRCATHMLIQPDVSRLRYFHPANPYPLSAVAENLWESGVGCCQQDNPAYSQALLFKDTEEPAADRLNGHPHSRVYS